MISLLILFLMCILFSAFFSGSEMAFVSAPKYKFREMADSGDISAKKIVAMQNQPQAFLTAILIGNNIVNVTATAILTYWLHLQFEIESGWLVTAIMVPLIIIFGEIIPKEYCRLHAQYVLLKLASVLSFFLVVFRVPAVLVSRGMDAFLKIFGVKKRKNIFVSETEFRLLIEESTQSGVLESHEKQLINMILDFERIQVGSVMIPLERVAKISLTGTVGDVKKIARETNAQMILVYEEIPSLIMGMIYVFDLLFEKDEGKGLRTYLRSPIFVSKNTSIEKAFLTLQEKRQSYAVVVDVRREVHGVVPIERLLAV